MKMKALKLFTLATLVFASCGKENREPIEQAPAITMTLENQTEVPAITETPDITEKSAEEEVLNRSMHKIKEGQYRLEIEDCQKIFYFEVCDHYLIVTKSVEGNNKLCIIDLTTAEEIKSYDVLDVYFVKLENGELLYYSYTGDGLIFHNITEEPEKLAADEMEKYSDELYPEIKEIVEFDIEMVATNQTFMYEREDYIVTAYMNAENEWWILIYRTSDHKLCYLDSVPKTEGYFPVSCAIEGKYVFLGFYNPKSEQTIIYCIEPGVEEIPVPKISGTYPDGITVLTGEAVILPETEGYIRGIVEDETKINRIRMQLEAALKKYPEGFWDELLYEGTYPRRSLVICLCGALGNEGGYVESPLGFAFETHDTYFVLADISETTEDTDYAPTFYHEFMHTIDGALDVKREKYEGWEDLLPANFEYSFYEQTEDHVLYSVDREEVYFVSTYGKTNPLEDRATLMADMMDFGMNRYKSYGPLYQRMQYMDELLKKNFRTVRECEKPYWSR